MKEPDSKLLSVSCQTFISCSCKHKRHFWTLFGHLHRLECRHAVEWLDKNKWTLDRRWWITIIKLLPLTCFLGSLRVTFHRHEEAKRHVRTKKGVLLQRPSTAHSLVLSGCRVWFSVSCCYLCFPLCFISTLSPGCWRILADINSCCSCRCADC